MWRDVVDIRDFYATGLGQVARQMIWAGLRGLWPNVTGLSVLGLGYAIPYLDPLRKEAACTLAVMPASQGTLPWPPRGPGLTALAAEFALPFPDLSLDRVLLVHGLEFGDQVRPMLREIWRVLGDGGRLLVVVPNRRGIWARMERTPFGHGSPYTASQLSRLLRDNMFTPVETRRALSMPPTSSKLLLRSTAVWEKVGLRWFPGFAGILLMEASKQIYAVTPATPQRRKAYAPVSDSVS
ncbi:MAG: methyltransferase type 11 [Rhodospirillaceae bacterium]|nr:MAG: methyltransferase type 11 [Rhodospirillaceae bacterium]